MHSKIFYTILLLLFSGISVAQPNDNGCIVQLDSNIDVQSYPANETVTLTEGTLIEYVGQSPDNSQWILRQSNQYFNYPTSAPDLRSVGCNPSQWGLPSPVYQPLTSIMDEIGVTSWHQAGYLGQGVRIGIIDTRYDDVNTLIDSLHINRNQIAAIPSFEALETLSTEANRTESHHGTNVLEIIAALAPQAQYVLAKSVDEMSFAQSVNELIAADVQIIVHASNVITANPTPYHDAVRRASDAGILWINAAGNIGAGYYTTQYTGDDIITVHQFSDPNRAGSQSSLMVPVNRVGSASVSLIWGNEANAFPNDFELVVYGSCNRRDSATFAPLRSDNDQSSGESAFENIQLTNGELAQISDYTTVPAVGTLQNCPDEAQPDSVSDNEIYITVVDSVGTAQVNTPLELYIEGALPSDYDPDISTSLDPVVLVPGDIAESFTVGAFDPNINKMAWFSGRFNSGQYYASNENVQYTTDELNKPDITTYGLVSLPSGRQFTGTSASTPIIAAVSAVIASSMNSFDADAVKNLMVNKAVSCLQDGAVGQNLGALKLPPPNTISTIADINCGQYEWQPDLTSQTIASFRPPEWIRAENRAEEEARRARANSLINASANFAADNYDLSLLLGLESLRLVPSSDSISHLFNLVYHNNPYIQKYVTLPDFPTLPIDNETISDDGNWYAYTYCSGQCNARLYDLRTSPPTYQHLNGYQQGTLAFANNRLWNFYHDGTTYWINSWDMESKQMSTISNRVPIANQWDGTTFGGSSFEFMPDAQVLVVDDYNETFEIQIYDLNANLIDSVPNQIGMPLNATESDNGDWLLFVDPLMGGGMVWNQSTGADYQQGTAWRPTSYSIGNTGNIVDSAPEYYLSESHYNSFDDNYYDRQSYQICNGLGCPTAQEVAYLGTQYLLTLTDNQLALYFNRDAPLQAWQTAGYMEVIGDTGLFVFRDTKDQLVFASPERRSAVESLGDDMTGWRDLLASVGLSPRRSTPFYMADTLTSAGSPGDVWYAYSMDQYAGYGIQILNARNYQLQQTIALNSPVTGLAIAPDDNTLAYFVAETGNSRIVIYDINQQTTQQEISLPNVNINGEPKILYSTDGRQLILITLNAILSYSTNNYALESVIEYTPLMTNQVNINTHEISPDNRYLAVNHTGNLSGFSDGSSFHEHKIYLFDLQNEYSIGTVLETSSHYRSTIGTIRLSANGDIITAVVPIEESYMEPGDEFFSSVINWFGVGDIKLSSWVNEACTIANRNLTPQEWQTYLPDSEYMVTCPATWLDASGTIDNTVSTGTTQNESVALSPTATFTPTPVPPTPVPIPTAIPIPTSTPTPYIQYDLRLDKTGDGIILTNISGRTLNINNLSFGNNNGRYMSAAAWEGLSAGAATSLASASCLQIWENGTAQPSLPADCTTLRSYFVSSKTSLWFWETDFDILFNSSYVMTCPLSQTSCSILLP